MEWAYIHRELLHAPVYTSRTTKTLGAQARGVALLGSFLVAVFVAAGNYAARLLPEPSWGVGKVDIVIP